MTWHFSLAQRRVKNGQPLTVKGGMVKKWQHFISEVTNFPHDTQEGHGCIGIP
jgi:hypothetical protein